MQASSTSNAYILEHTVYHARHLPVTSKHSFTYPTLALFLRLSALECHSLDLFSGRLFGFSDAGSYFPWARIMGIRPEAYLHDPSSYRTTAKKWSIREKLESVLKRFEIDSSELDDVWMLTMPRYLGVEGINPLTVYYCYRKNSSGSGEAELWVVVLEVHNTFGERHVYVLRTGSEYEDKEIVSGYTHSWTFPRQFHVSPFNDRSGYYTCSIVAPPTFPQSSDLESSLNLETRHRQSSPRLPKVLIQLWTPEKQLKLTASLRSKSAIPLSSRNVIAAIAKYPFTLLLSFPRIAWQAFHLHYPLRLDVYARPEPRAVDPALEDSFNIDGIAGTATRDEKVRRNDVQRLNGELGTGGSIGWQPEGLLERYARKRVERFIEMRAREVGMKVHLVSTNPAYESKTYPHNRNDDYLASDTEEKELTILIRSSRALSLILTSPSSEFALLLARDAERLLVVSDEKLFLELFSLSSGYVTTQGRRATILQRVLQWLRKLPIPRSLLLAPDMRIPNIHPLDLLLPLPLPHPHPYSHFRSSAMPSETPVKMASSPLLHEHELTSSLPTLLVLTTFLILTHLEKAIFSLLGARFVKGTEPWRLWGRAESAWLTRGSRWEERDGGDGGDGGDGE